MNFIITHFSSWFKKLFIMLLIIVFFSCDEDNSITPPDNQTPDFHVTAYGDSSSFEIATWNIENFPKASSTTINNLANIITDLDVDLIAVEEITNTGSFNSLLTDLSGWDGVLSSDVYNDGSYQKTGIMYKTEIVNVSNVRNIFTNDSYAFPRPPLTAFVEIKDSTGIKYDFNIIVLHLKAYGDSLSVDRRRQACSQLKDYIDQQITTGDDADFIVLGDWNDQLADADSVNVFMPFLVDSSGYTFLTEGISDKYSYISDYYNSLIDHILITGDSAPEFSSGNTDILYLDSEFSDYESTISDHRPVVAKFKGFELVY